MKLHESRRRVEDSEEEDDEVLRRVEDDELPEGSATAKPSWKALLRLFRSDSQLTASASSRDLVAAAPPSDAFFIRPDNGWYLAWTQFILLWAVYSSFFTPLEFGFFRGLPENLFLLDAAGQIAFLVDIVVRFFVAYRDSHSHRLVHSRKLIALRYLKSRFLVDFLGCLPWDGIYKACGRKEPVRYLLWIRLSRALRVTEFFAKMEKDIRINYLFTRIVKLLVVELYCTHTAACIFYYLATTLPPSREGYTWIGSLQMGDYSYSHFRDIDLWRRYITSLYFAIVTMATVGYGEIHAVNIREMIFVMAYVSFDMILGAYLLGNMTALIVKGSKTERFRDKMTDLIKYMNRHKLGKGLSNEVKGHLRLQYESSYTEAAVLQDIPISTRAKATRVHEEIFLPGEVVIEQGHIVDQLYFVYHGKLEGKSKDDETAVLHLQTFSSFGEVSILCNIPALYTVRVCELSKLLRLDKQSFTEVLEIYFSDGRIIVNNVLEGKESNLQNKLLESDITLNIAKHECELTMRLNCAAHDGDLYRLKRLIGAGADPNRSDYDRRSPLHLAASRGYEEIAEFLVQKGVGINVKDNFGNTPLLEAIKNGHDRIASLLVKAGASLAIDNAGSFLCMVVASRDSDFLRRLLANGINPNSKNYDLRTPLHLAAAEGLVTVVCLLLQAGASVFSKDRWGNTPLDEARIGGDKNLIQLLEDAKRTQLSDFSDCFKETQAQDQRQRRICTVFPFNPWDKREDRRQGVVLRIPQGMEELVAAAARELQVPGAACILSETGGRILDIGMISDGQNLFLVNEET
ncbi:potassium channel SKOR-like isoform X2 [Diospyros lotus]|uniref:potassium channel SKOR-like isoform X2 n=1 Tax=Diospyros lotus TaxID=55363 RepID=UPI0022515422|nr:potassium channel SKOR-like isoform X2 [Diospyros lotus]